MSDEVKFPDGISVYAPRESAPDYILGDVVIRAGQMTEYLRAASIDGELRLTLKRSKGGKLYFQVNEWRPQKQTNQQQAPQAPAPQAPAPQAPAPFPTQDNFPGLEAGSEEMSSIPF